MSAFMVDDDVLSALAQALKRGVKVGTLVCESSRQDFKVPIDTIARNLHDMNERAIVARYGEPFDKDGAFTYRVQHQQSPRWVYRQLRCLMYQCSEGNVPDEPLFKAIEEYADDLSEAIIDSLPGSDALPWGTMNRSTTPPNGDANESKGA